MVTQPGPYVAFLSALRDAHAANALSPSTFTPGAQGVTPGPGAPGDAPGGTVGGIGVGAGGASVPGTATTGQSLLEDIIQGADPNAPASADLVGRLFSRGEPGERGDLGAGVTGGNLGALSAVLGGPLAPASIIASLVASTAAGLPPDPGLLSTAGLAGLVGLGNDESVADTGLTDNVVAGVRNDIGNINTALDAAIAADPRTFGGGRQESEADRGNRGGVSQADRTRSASNREAGGGFTR